jgi:hypothetical protein
MGFFSSFWEGVTSFASNVWEGVKSVAKAAVGWMAEKAEQFIGAVSRVWQSVKTFIKPVLKVLKYIPWPPLQWVVTVIEKGINFLEKLEKTVLAKSVGKAIEWTIQVATKVNGYILDEGERREAEQRKLVLSEAKEYLEGEPQKAIQIAEMTNDFLLLQSEIQDYFETKTIKNFEHYLRLRAAQKLLKMTNEKLGQEMSVDQIGKGDLFIIEIARELLQPNPKIDDSSLDMLNGLIQKRYRRDLIPFIFEEMIIAWSKNLSELETNWDTNNEILAEKTIRLRELESKIKMGISLDEEESLLIKELAASVLEADANQKLLNKEIIVMRNYVYAAEGFLQILEENEELNNKTYLLEEGNEVGKIIIDCAQNGKQWDELTEKERDLIIDFSNIFREASKEREKLLYVEVSA